MKGVENGSFEPDYTAWRRGHGWSAQETVGHVLESDCPVGWTGVARSQRPRDRLLTHLRNPTSSVNEAFIHIVGSMFNQDVRRLKAGQGKRL